MENYDKLEKGTGLGPRSSLNNSRNFFTVSKTSGNELNFAGSCSACLNLCSRINSYKDDNGFMEKKINKTFFLFTALNIIPAVLMGGGLTKDSLILVGVLAVLVLNYFAMVKMVAEVTKSAVDGTGSIGKILFLFALKMTLLGSVLAGAYFYNKDIILKVIALAILQLIIQVFSITNNNQKN